MREEAIKKAEAETLGHAKERAKQLEELIAKIRAKTNEMVGKKRKCEEVEVKDEGAKEEPGEGPAAPGEASGE